MTRHEALPVLWEDEEGGGIVECPYCNSEMGDPVDNTYSDYDSGRAVKGQHTGDIYYCEKCDIRWLDDFLDQCVVEWHG